MSGPEPGRRGEPQAAGASLGEPLTDEDRRAKYEEDWKLLKTAMAAHLIEPYHLLFERTRNPIHALDAYRIARAAKIDLPPWVLALFDQWAETLTAERPKGAKAIADALGLGTKGGPSITVQAEKETRNLRMGRRIFDLQDSDPGRDMLDIFNQVAEESDLSSERVADIWYKLRHGKP